MKWLDDFKIALIEEDESRLTALVESMPEEMSVEEAKAASTLILQAKKFLETKKSEVLAEMKKLAKTRESHVSSHNMSEDENRLDLTT